MSTITTIAGAAGRISGTAGRGLIWAYRTIDWAEVGAIVLHGVQVLIVLTLMAGQLARQAWDALPGFSEELGQVASFLLVGLELPATASLAGRSHRELMALAGTRRKLSKSQLIELIDLAAAGQLEVVA